MAPCYFFHLHDITLRKNFIGGKHHTLSDCLSVLRFHVNCRLLILDFPLLYRVVARLIFNTHLRSMLQSISPFYFYSWGGEFTPRLLASSKVIWLHVKGLRVVVRLLPIILQWCAGDSRANT